MNKCLPEKKKKKKKVWVLRSLRTLRSHRVANGVEFNRDRVKRGHVGIRSCYLARNGMLVNR